jgi:hypothetical protein
MAAGFRIPLSPVAHDAAVVHGDQYRITVLTTGLVRTEWAEDGRFEDRASTFALHHDLPVPEFRVVNGAEVVESSDRFHVTDDRQRPSASGLKVDFVGGITAWHSTWRFGDEDASLHGTARHRTARHGTARHGTLDVVDGRTPLGPGVVAEGGVAVLDDSASFLLTEDGWVADRPDGDRFDLHVFTYGHDFWRSRRPGAARAPGWRRCRRSRPRNPCWRPSRNHSPRCDCSRIRLDLRHAVASAGRSGVSPKRA